MKDIEKENKFKSYCNNCMCLTNHIVLFSKTIHEEDVPVEYMYQIIECMGCENLTFRKETNDYTGGYQEDDGSWTHLIDIKTYPPPFKHTPLTEVYWLPANIQIIYDETISCLKFRNFLLAGVGFRTIVEAVCIDKSISGRNLEAKINNLAKTRFITDIEANRLHAIRFMGNDSAHEINVPSEEAIEKVLEIVNHLLSNLYVIDQHAGYVLDTYVETQFEFEAILRKRILNFDPGVDLPLVQFLGKDVRRLNGKLSIYEKTLIENIKNGIFPGLNLGEKKINKMNPTENLQHFIRNEYEEELPF